jgi:AraC family cel operon transcriptional repressor
MSKLKKMPVFTWNEDRKGENIIYHFWRNSEVGGHSHEFYELFLVTEGKVLHEFNGALSVLDEGTLCLIKPGDCHKFSPCGESSSTHFNMKITLELYNAICGVISSSMQSRVEGAEGLISYNMKVHEFEYFRSTLETLCMYSPTRSERDVSASIRSVAVGLFGYINSALNASDEGVPEWLLAYIDLLGTRENFSKPLSELYKLSPYSQTRLGGYFRKYLGCTLVAYITKIKLKYASSLLSSTNYKVLEIALSSGFRSLSRFNHVFKMNFGTTPVEYRKTHSIL